MTYRLLPALLVLAGIGCGGDACKVRVNTKVDYAGSRTGVFYTREVAPDGVVTSAASGTIAAGQRAPSTSTACFPQALPADQPGWKLEGWLDLDGDDVVSCALDGIKDRARCAPDPGEPQGVVEFTLRANDDTSASLVVIDP